jgi:hypothetical protein
LHTVRSAEYQNADAQRAQKHAWRKFGWRHAAAEHVDQDDLYRENECRQHREPIAHADSFVRVGANSHSDRAAEFDKASQDCRTYQCADCPGGYCPARRAALDGKHQ